MYCMECGADIANEANFCGKCGAQQTQENVSALQKTQSVQSQPSAPVIQIQVDSGRAATPSLEKSFLHEKGVIVTSSRFILPNHTFAMSGVTSVKFHEEPPKRFVPILIAVIGGVFAISEPLRTAGVVMLAVGIIILALQKTVYHVLLKTASGEEKPLSDKDGQWIRTVVGALNESIIHRG